MDKYINLDICNNNVLYIYISMGNSNSKNTQNPIQKPLKESIEETVSDENVDAVGDEIGDAVRDEIGDAVREPTEEPKEQIVGIENSNNNILKVCSWNVEDFTKVYKYDYKQLYENDILLIQEWKEKYEEIFMNSLNDVNEQDTKFKHTKQDRVGLVYNKNLYRILYSKPIKLVYEAPRNREKIYTQGRQKSNILVVLEPINPKTYPTLAVIVVHLSAYYPPWHPTLHTRQFTQLLVDSIKFLQQQKFDISKIKFIMGGDTNYKKPLNEADNLYQNILKPIQPQDICDSLCNFVDIPMKELIQSLQLKDVCKNSILSKDKNGNSLYIPSCSIPTQSFKCIHEAGISKGITSVIGKTGAISDSRLDILISNLKARNTQIIPMCKYSDHNAIFTELLLPIIIYGGKRKSLKRKSLKRKCLKRKSLKKNFLKRKSLKRKSS